MWRKSFVATAVALGSDVDDAVRAIGDDVATPGLVQALKAPHRATRAATLAKAVRDVVVAIDEVTLR